jgi:hypothetical protein
MSFRRLCLTLRQILEAICPRELIQIMSEYAADLHHTWYKHQDDAKPVTIIGNCVSCSYAKSSIFWFRVLAMNTISTSPQRWRIQIHALADILVGISCAAVGPIEKRGQSWSTVAGPDDLFVAPLSHNRAYTMSHGHWKEPELPNSPPFGPLSRARIAIDTHERIMRVTLEDKSSQRQEIALPIPEYMALADCRPCVVVGGLTIASILPYEDEDLPPPETLDRMVFEEDDSNDFIPQ